MSRLKRIVLLLLSDTAAVSLASVFFLWMKLAGGGLEIVRHNYEQLFPDAVAGPSFLVCAGLLFGRVAADKRLLAAAVFVLWLLPILAV